MFVIILIMAAGIAVGRLLRYRRLSRLGAITNILIWILLFLLGVEVGGDERIVKGMATLGAEGIGIALAGVAGSALLAAGLWRLTRGGRKGGRQR